MNVTQGRLILLIQLCKKKTENIAFRAGSVDMCKTRLCGNTSDKLIMWLTFYSPLIKFSLLACHMLSCTQKTCTSPAKTNKPPQKNSPMCITAGLNNFFMVFYWI